MIDVLLAFVGGLFAGVVTVTIFSGRGRAHVEVENQQLREALRYVRGVTAHHPDVRALSRYVDQVLDDEAGA